ncbi:MAG: flagellar hook protein FlgE [Proteobacteria bacterium]|nr:flagellar hook protein FlgE [Pseudomonadota bacterium]
MSITNSLYIGISGLQAHGDAISVIGDNIANTSTVGYKRNRAEFADVLGGQLGGSRLGGGVRLGGTQTMYDQGSIQQTGAPLDMAIRGKGFFVVQGNNDGKSGQYYTRDGRFSLDNTGTVVDPRGLKLQGYAIDSAGTRSTSIGDLALGGRQSPPVATTSAKMSLNLDASEVPPTAPWDPAAPNATSNYATSQTVYDSLGASHRAEVYFRSTGTGGWEWHAMVDGGEVGGTAGTPTEIATGTLTFSPTGALTNQTMTSSAASFTNATPGQVINFTFDNATSFDTNQSTINGVDIDGHGAGTLIDLAISEDGKVTGVFDNGDRLALAQVALADFTNEQGLARAGNGLVTATNTSGDALIDAAGAGSRGAISAGALEGSNVDLGTELVTLIAYQRAFQANAKTVTTADEMLMDINNLKR